MKKLYLMPLLFLTACSMTKPPALVLQPEPPLPATDNSAIRYPEVIRAYHVGRYVDPNDDLVMHERHAVYRVEENSRWNLHPGPAGGNLPALAPAHDSTFSPTPVNDAILAQVNSQRLATAQIMAQARTLSAALAQFQAALQQTRTNLQEMAVLRAAVIEMNKRLDALETQREQPPAPSLSLTNEPPDSMDP